MIEDEAVVLDIPGKTLRGLSSVASRIWQLIDGKRSIREIAKAIAEEYACGEQEVFDDVKVFLKGLLEKKIITLEVEPR